MIYAVAIVLGIALIFGLFYVVGRGAEMRKRERAEEAAAMADISGGDFDGGADCGGGDGGGGGD